ncbi:T-cell immunoglobulin and mucin domain-containing protein 4 isoform X3 [Acanthopagrus latus]|uniref:T-cell immunoglobulin and mucin domain-containing protein 4 isoform X2 n=1 Tax=Acanthopagrus latus TaxID=8177 RepID=UPI00187BCD07|nr:T-cell immunoglobulin and mucin domain-containing protein 4 isoform X2 [Acanthopagrus latus]XP_036975087.1 T-cell immunoglobulin and mucin domain-containing protein 4 isoform X3 [Acanthopagrus latus]
MHSCGGVSGVCQVCQVCLCAAGGHFSSVSCFKVLEGGVASLSCQYSVKRFGLSRVCWGRGCGTFWCNNILVQTDENGVISKVEDRYRLTGDVLDGQMDLDILNVRRTDSGPYCCRVDIDGIFNDKKVIMNLRVVKAPVTSSPPTTTTTTAATTNQVTEPSTSTVNWKSLLSSQLDLLRRNSTLQRSDTITVEDSLPSLSLQINVPVLSLSLSVLLMLAAVFLFLAFKRTFSLLLTLQRDNINHSNCSRCCLLHSDVCKLCLIRSWENTVFIFIFSFLLITRLYSDQLIGNQIQNTRLGV